MAMSDRNTTRNKQSNKASIMNRNNTKPPLLFLLALLWSARGEQPFQSRELKLQCPLDEFNDDGEKNANIEGQFDAYSRGANGRDLVDGTRTRPESYYQDIVNNIIMMICDVETASERCVEKDSPFAAKDWSGENCIQAADFVCPSGMCERSSNCYWNTVYEGENRTTRFPVEKYEEARDKIYGIGTDSNSYAREIAQFGIAGIVVACLLLFFWFVFFIARYLCCCLWIPCKGFCFLCSPIPRTRGYKPFKDIFIPVLIYVICFAAVLVATTMAFIGNEDVSVAASNTFLHADGMVEDLGKFLGRSRIPLVNIQSIVNDAALDAKSIFDGTDYVKNDALEIVDSFLGFYSLHSDGLNASNSLSGFNSATSGFDEKVTPIVDNVQYMLDTLQLDLYEKKDTIDGGIQGALGQLDSFSDQSRDWQNQIYEYEAAEVGLRPMRQYAVMAIFLVSLAVSFLGLIGIIMSKTNKCSTLFHLLKITGFFSAVIGSLALVAASVFLCVSFLFHDACKISDIVTRDFEPFVGDKVAPGANACFNDTNLAVAFNVTEKVDFQQKLDEGLSHIENVNVSQNFLLVLNPLSQIQSMLGAISDTALDALNQATASNEFPCPFTDSYTKDTILVPWDLDRGITETPYIIRDNSGNPTSYARVGSETTESYFSRIYNKAGICSAQTSCCIAPSATCESDVHDDCDAGDNCSYLCEPVRQGIIAGFNAFELLYEKERRMTADLGVECPSNFDDTCPTQEFKSLHANLTLVGLIKAYEVKIVDTKDSLVNLASTSVGDAMNEVEDFLCNMNVSFVERRYDEVKDDVCGKMYGGIAQINWAFWMLGIALEIIAILAHVLSVRLRGVSESQAALDFMY